MVVQRWFGALAALVLFTSLGCAHPSKIAFRYDTDGQAVPFRRRERNITRDWIHHPSRQIYTAGASFNAADGDEGAIALEIGQPDWTRKFTSYEDERVVEWVYVGKAQVAQFIGGQCVFQGPLTDYEQILLTHGRPSRAISQFSDTGDRIDLLIYDGIFFPELQQYHFLDGRATQFQEGD